tara:strand:- start:112576 stop:114951 length:2376 start_codon:yes stop_codon:yes gene_type:complete
MAIVLKSVSLSVLLIALVSTATADDATNVFLRDHCLDCHTGTDSEAGLDIESLQHDLSDPASLDAWIKIVDRVDAGEMPPEDAGEVDSEEAFEFLSTTGDWIKQYQRDQHDRFGRVRGRRLTNLQLERTLHDLLGIDVPLAAMMSDEPRAHGFNNIAEAQAMSHFQLASHLNVVDTALDTAFARAAESDSDVWRREYTARELARSDPRRRCRDPEMRNGLAVVWSHRLIFYGRVTSTTMRKSGWYTFTVKASAVNQPDDHGVWCTVRSGRCNSGAPLMNWIGSFEATEQPRELTFTAWIPKDHMLEFRPGDETLRQAKTQGGQVGTGECEDQNVPGLALHSMVIEEIHPGGSVSDVRQSLFGDLDVTVSKKGELVIADGKHAQRMAQQLRRFTQRAFRREVTPEQIQPYVESMRQDLAAGMNPIEALRKAYRAVLCSPRFLYFVEPAGKLDDDAIASRLSYLFTGSMPDDALRGLAERGELSDPDQLHAQVERLLDGESGSQFVRDFADQWLDLVDIDFTDPDRRLHNDFDIVVQDGMLNETRRYLQFLIENNVSAKQLIDSDFTFLNSRLARFYGIDGVAGDQWRKVSLNQKHHRGGLLAHGSILKVTANGTNTSPVLRGVWVCERILGQTIPPPPENVPAIEPDIRGATTIREMLAKHRSDTACASCHEKIDPAGFALENFDAAGRWRDRYIQVVGRKLKPGSPVDPSYSMPDGRSFDDFDTFREIVSEDVRPLARNFAEKLLTYATGGPIEFADRDEIDRIVSATEPDDYGLRSLIHQAIVSDIFLYK